MLESNRRYPGWAEGWGVVEGDPPGWTFAGIFATEEEARAAAAKAGPAYQVRWGNYDEPNKEFISGNSP